MYDVKTAPELHTLLHEMGLNIIIHGNVHSPINYTAREYVRNALIRWCEVTLSLDDGTGIAVICDTVGGPIRVEPLN